MPKFEATSCSQCGKSFGPGDSGYSHCADHIGTDAARALLAWDDSEKAGPDYGSMTRDTHPDGEAIWQCWWSDQQRLCERAFDMAREAVKIGTPDDPPKRMRALYEGEKRAGLLKSNEEYEQEMIDAGRGHLLRR